MKSAPEACCVVCQLVFCCANCRLKHEKSAHGLTYECPICRGNSFLCKPQELNQDFIKHLYEEHLPLRCKKCNKYFTKMDDLVTIEECTSISELVIRESDPSKSQLKELDEKFDSIYDNLAKKGEIGNIEAFVSVNKSSKMAVITPIVRRQTIVDYDSSESETEDSKPNNLPNPKLVSKTPKIKRQRAATPHAKKLLGLMRQKVVEEYEETVDEDGYDGSPVTNKTTPSRNENCVVPDNIKEMTTPTSHIQHVLKLAQIVTTSTPTHPVVGGWALFPEQSADSPLSEIENTESPAQSMNNEPSKSENIAPKLKSIIVTGSRIRLGSQDSSEKHVTFQESENNTDASSMRIKKVKFAEDTVFEQEKINKRVYRKPKRMLTPGPQKPRHCLNPRFQALINRFETCSNQGQTVARTPVHNREKTPECTPATGEAHMPARAINFKDDSPVIETENCTKDSNELFKTCVDSPTTVGINTAITALTTNIAGSLQNCLNTALRTTEEETEVQFKFVITKKKVSVKRIAKDDEGVEERSTEFERDSEANKENIWSSVAKVVRNVFWGEQGNNLAISTPHSSCNSDESTRSSASKRKCEEMTEPVLSPLNHKRHRYDGRIGCRPPLRRSKTWGVTSLRSSKSAEQQSLLKEISTVPDDAMNQSF